MNVLSYGVGVATPFAAVALVLGFLTAMEDGKEIECRACGYSTGPMRETRRITCWVRWRWHKLTTGHHTRRWNRQLDRAGVPR